MELSLKNSANMVMDAFDDAAMNLPGNTKEERIVALVDELLPRLIDRAVECGAMDDNSDLPTEQKAAFMKLLRFCLEETPDCAAVLAVRLLKSGDVMVAGGSKGLRDEALSEMSRIVRMAIRELAKARMGDSSPCNCPACQELRLTKAAPIFNGPKAEA